MASFITIKYQIAMATQMMGYDAEWLVLVIDIISGSINVVQL